MAPLLGYLRDLIQPLPESQWTELLDQAQIYTFHRELFLSWLKTGTPKRTDEILYYPAEQRFEQEQIFQGLARLLALVHKEIPAFFVWEDFQNAGASLVKCLERMVQDPPQGRVAFICILRQSGHTMSKWKQESWRIFFSLVESKGCFFRLRDPLPSEPRPEPPRPQSPKQLRHSAAVARAFLAYDDSMALLTSITKKSGRDGAEADFLLGEIYFLQENYVNAILYLNLALEEARRHDLIDLESKIFDRLSLCHFRKKDFVQAQKYWKQGQMSASRAKDPLLEASFVLTQITLNESLLTSPSFWPKLAALQKTLHDQGHLNSLSFLESLVPYYRGIIDRQGWDAAVLEARTTLDRVRAQGNSYRESVLYHTLGYLHEYNGLKAEAFRYFQKGIALRQRLGDPVELIKVYNGTGYFCFTIGDFHTAVRFFEKSLGLLEPLKDYTETCLTLYNMAMVYFFSGQFSVALTFLENILEVMDNLQLKALPWHTRTKLYSLAGIASYHLGFVTRSLDFWESADEEELDDAAEPSYYILKALVGRELGQNDWIDQYSLKAVQSSQHLNLGYFEVHALMERAILMGALGDERGKEECLALGKNLLTAHPIEAQVSILSHLQQGQDWTTLVPSLPRESRVEILIRGLTSSARQEASSHELFQKIHEINFLKNFQGLLTMDQSSEKLLDEAMGLIRQNFLISRWALTHPSSKDSSKGFSFFLKSLGQAVNLSSEAEDLSDNEIKVISVALTQLDLVLDLHKTKETLKLAATIDALTGVFSRQEVLRRLELERKRALRYKSGENKTFAVLFLDLDNFKYYNDAFGHGAGDLILRQFSGILLGHLRDVDLAGRYGGDEFIVILPETDINGAMMAGKRILDSVIAAQGFSSTLKIFLGKDIPPLGKNSLGCSIGIAVFDENRHSSCESLLSEADNALYIAKKSGKGQCVAL